MKSGILGGNAQSESKSGLDFKTAVVIGDSIAKGFPNATPETIPDYLTTLTGFDWINHGVNSTVVADKITNFDTEVGDAIRKYCLVHIGVNDVYNNTNIDTFKENYTLLLNKIQARQMIGIVFCVPYSNRDIAKWNTVDVMNAFIKLLCTKLNFYYIDYGNWSKANKDNATYYADFVHPAPAGYEYMANLVYDAVFL